MPKTKPTLISKSQFILGLQCQKALWLKLNAKELARVVTASQQALFDSGTEVGELAQTLYPKGVLIDCDYWEVKEAEAKTKAEIKNGATVLFEAMAINPQGAYSKIDILKRRGERTGGI